MIGDIADKQGDKGGTVFTVQDLIEELSVMNREAIVVLSSDAEGNSFDPLFSVEEMMYNPKWKDVGYRELTEQMKSQGYTDEDIMSETDGQPAVVLWP